MPDTATIDAPAAAPAPEPAQARKPTATKRKLGAGGWIAASWLILIVLIAIFGPLLVAGPTKEGSFSSRNCGDGSGLPVYDPLKCRDREAVRNQRETGSADSEKYTHLTGVDNSGRDVFSRVLIGTRTTLIIAVVSILAATLIGGALGLIAGYFRGTTDTGISTLFDVMIAFPPLILALMLVLNFAGNEPGRRVPAIIIALMVVASPILGRISRVSTLSWSQREFVTASKALGAKPFRVITREVLPNVVPAMMSIAMLGIGIAVVTESSLALIGLGVPADTVSWGAVVAQGGADFRNFPHLVFVPSVPIVITVCALNFLGDALRKKFDVRESALG
jgi:peptide/nickel transport system permease protein